MSRPYDREASRVPKSQRSGGRRFDHNYGVTTHAVLFLTDLDGDAAGDAGAHATHYEAVPVGDFNAMLAFIPPDAIPSATLVDVGAGMGRALILAAEHPFKQVCGIEISPSLYEIAKENVKSARSHPLRCRDIRLHLNDARIWNYPPGDLVIFLFNPFDAQALRATLGSITGRRDPGRTWLLYHTPVERAAIEAESGWEKIGELSCGGAYAAK
jgi:SAM-dependent methyltransferase